MKLSGLALAVAGLFGAGTAITAEDLVIRLTALVTAVGAVVTPVLMHRAEQKRLAREFAERLAQAERESRERAEEADRLADIRAAEVLAAQGRFEMLVKYGLLNTEQAALATAERAERMEDLLVDLERKHRELALNTSINSSVVDPIRRHKGDLPIPIPDLPPRQAGTAGSGIAPSPEPGASPK